MHCQGLTQSELAFIQHICVYLNTGVRREGRSGLFPERCLTPVLVEVNVFLSATFLGPCAAVCFPVKNEQDLNIKPIVASLCLGLTVGCSDPLLKTCSLLASAFLHAAGSST